MEVYDHNHGNGVRMCSAVAKSFCELTFLSREAILKLSTCLLVLIIFPKLVLSSDAPTTISNIVR